MSGESTVKDWSEDFSRSLGERWWRKIKALSSRKKRHYQGKQNLVTGHRKQRWKMILNNYYLCEVELHNSSKYLNRTICLIYLQSKNYFFKPNNLCFKLLLKTLQNFNKYIILIIQMFPLYQNHWHKYQLLVYSV